MKTPFFKQVIRWGFALTLLFVVVFALGDISELRSLPEVHWNYVFFAFLSNVGFTLAHNFRWKRIAEALSPSKRSHFFTLYRFLIDSYAIGKIIPMDASLLGVRSYYLKEFQKIPISVALFSVLLDRFLDLVLLLILAIPSFLLITKATSSGQSFLLLFINLLVFALVIVWKKGETFYFFLDRYRHFTLRWVSRIPWIGQRMMEGVEAAAEPHRFRLNSVIWIMIWNLVKYFFLSCRFYLTGLALGISFPFVQSFFFLPLVLLSGLINVTPAGLGVIEMGTYGALFLMEVTPSKILIFVLGQRVLLFPMFLAIFMLNYFFLFISSILKGRR